MQCRTFWQRFCDKQSLISLILNTADFSYYSMLHKASNLSDYWNCYWKLSFRCEATVLHISDTSQKSHLKCKPGVYSLMPAVTRPCICHFKSAWLNKGKKDFSHPRRIFICQILIHYVVLFMFSDLRKRIFFQWNSFYCLYSPTEFASYVTYSK